MERASFFFCVMIQKIMLLIGQRVKERVKNKGGV
jgi:hypothetical protein